MHTAVLSDFTTRAGPAFECGAAGGMLFLLRHFQYLQIAIIQCCVGYLNDGYGVAVWQAL